MEIVVTADPAVAARADVAINHFDMTVVPPDVVDALSQCPIVVNRDVRDISKRRISNQLVSGPDDVAGPVIVKTDANARGNSERRQLRQRSKADWIRESFKKKFQPWYRSGVIGKEGYRVYDTPAAVPAAVWANRWFVVERFRPEIRDGKYVLRTWLFLGDREIHIEAYSDDPIVKRSNVVGHGTLGAVPENLIATRHDLGFDYGKFDYVAPDGEAILLDANRTPTADVENPRIAAYAGHLAGGIDRFVDKCDAEAP